ncbi:S8 family peptidase [Candidatus Nitrospira salsa]
MTPLQLIKLNALMQKTSGRPEIVVGLIDGPVMMQHTALLTGNIRAIAGVQTGTCMTPNSCACIHGTFVAGILSATRHSTAPGICPNCTLLVRPIFHETMKNNGIMPQTTPEHLAAAIVETIEGGARIVNLSLAIETSTIGGHRQLQDALDFAASRRAMLVSATGNQGTVGGTVLTQHIAVIPVMAYGLQSRPLDLSNLGLSIGRHGLGAPGENITSLGPTETAYTLSGTSAAAPFVTGTIALLWSLFPSATVEQMKFAITQSTGQRRKTVVPPLVDAEAAYHQLHANQSRR